MPRLQRFYGGGSVLAWFTEVPAGLVTACIEMLPRLEAEEAIDAASRAAAAWGGEGGSKLLAQWQAQASGRDRPAARAAGPGQLAGMGIGYRVAPPRSAPKQAAG